MTLSKRATLLIIPVLFTAYTAVALAVFFLESSSIERREQARLNNNLTEAQSVFAAYSSFVDSYLYAISESEEMHRYLGEQDDHYRQQVLGAKLASVLNSFKKYRSQYLSFALIRNTDQPLFFFASSDNPFQEISEAERTFAGETLAQRRLTRTGVVHLASGKTLLIQNRLVDERTFAAPLPSRLGHSVVMQMSVELDAYDNRLATLAKTYGVRPTYETHASIDRLGLAAEVRLLPNLYLKLQPPAGFINGDLHTLRISLLVAVLLLTACSAGVLLWLIRRYITQPVVLLDDQLSAVMHHREHNIKLVHDEGEIGRLAHKFQQLYDQLSESYRRSRDLAERDSLTGLPNRTRFYELAVRELKQAADFGKAVGLLYIDLDHFKFVNDKYGHSVGDALLKSFSHRVSALLKHEGERAPLAGQAVLARLAGDEFAVLLSRYENASFPEHIAHLILGLVQNGYHFEMGSYPVTASIGIAAYPGDGHTIAQLVSNADTAMYQAKHGGKNQLAFYSQELAKKARRIMEIEHQLKSLECDEEFYLTYMPILSSAGTVVGCEALLRWNSPTLGAVGPDEFIPIAERCGLYSKVDRWVLKRACEDYAELSRVLCDKPILSINLSSAELTVVDFDRYLADTLAQTGVAPELIEIEMTETFGVESSRQRDHLLQRLRALGVQIAIDDFGTGYTSMMQMLEYPIDKIKLDRSFVTRLMTPGNQTLLAPIISLFHARGVSVTAEGVETAQQKQMLIDNGCDYLQGYLVGKPMRLPELAVWAVESPGLVDELLQ